MAEDNKATQDYQKALKAFFEKAGVTDTQYIDGAFRASMGSINNGLADIFSGINHEANPSALPVNKESYGMVFFTRPIMNMTRDNVKAERCFAPLLSKDPSSIGYMIRAMFDYRLGYPNHTGEILKPTNFDNKQAFITPLCNTCVGLTGFPDATAPVFVATEGLQKETFGYVDGVVKDYQQHQINATFRNTATDFITLISYYWILYASNVFRGVMAPWPDMLMEDEVDYQTRIWRLTLDQTKRYVRRIGCTGASFPIGAQTGTSFDFTSERAWAIDNSTISIPFQSFGALVYDPILVYEFNQAVCFFNPDMVDGVREKLYAKIEQVDRPYVRNKGYPRINPDADMELEWWMPKAELANIIGTASKLQLIKGKQV